MSISPYSSDLQRASALAERARAGDAGVRAELERLTRKLERGPHVATFARCCLGLAQLAAIDLDVERVNAALDRGLSAASFERCPMEWLKLLNFRGYQFLVNGQLIEALEPLLSVARRAPQVSGAEGEAAQAFGNLGTTLSALGDAQGSLEMLRKSQAFARRVGLVSKEVQAAAMLVLEHVHFGDRAAAEETLSAAEASLLTAVDVPDRSVRRMRAALLRAQAVVGARWGAPEAALETSIEAARALAEWGDPEEIGTCKAAEAMALMKLGRLDEAWEAVLLGVEMAKEVSGGRMLSGLCRLGAGIAESRGDLKGMRLLLTELSRASVGAGFKSVGGMARGVIERQVAETELRELDLQGSVHALQRSNEQLAEARDVAERAVVQRQQFLAHMSHELRTPLHGVMGTAELLQGTELTEEQGELVGIVQRSAELTLAVVDDILDLGKLEAKGLTLESEVFLLQRPLQDVLSALRGRAKTTRLELDLCPDLPVAVRGDPRRLQQVLMNLVGNALKYTRGGLVRVGLKPIKEHWVRFEVQDDGLGIPQERLADLFNPYVQAKQLRGVGGTGLGLAICKGIVEGYGGRIGVSSELGVGSTFWFELPLPSAELETDHYNKSEGLFEGLSVLVAEDNPVNRMLMERQLQVLGAKVLLAEDGAQAVTRTLDHRPDLVLMDMHMPGMDGLEATRKLRSAGFFGPIVALTASVMEEDRGACLASGMDGFLTKPLSQERLLKTAEVLLRRVA